MKRRRIGKKCRKIRYRTEKEARDALRALRPTGAKKFYRCPFCPGNPWHLTSQERR